MAASPDPNLVFFDLETQKSFDEVGGRDRFRELKLSVAVTYSTKSGQFREFREADAEALVKELQSADLVVGFNTKRFDYEVLSAYTKEDLQKLPSLDMLEEVHKRLGFRVGLDALASTSLGERKSADGLQAIRWYRQGEFRKLLDYCRQHVMVTMDLYQFGRQNRFLLFQDKQGRTRRVDVAW